MSESATNIRVMKALRGHHPIRVENVACAGTPDINFSGGWLENKHLDRWPVRGGIVRVDHFSPQQRLWHIQRHLAGGRSWVFLQVGREYLLFTGRVAAEHLGKVTESKLREQADGCWANGLDESGLLELLSR